MVTVSSFSTNCRQLMLHERLLSCRGQTSEVGIRHETCVDPAYGHLQVQHGNLTARSPPPPWPFSIVSCLTNACEYRHPRWQEMTTNPPDILWLPLRHSSTGKPSEEYLYPKNGVHEQQSLRAILRDRRSGFATSTLFGRSCKTYALRTYAVTYLQGIPVAY